VLPLVRLVELADRAGMKAGLVMGSYFTFFNRTRPEMKLVARHPYIRSRFEQQTRGIQAAGSAKRPGSGRKRSTAGIILLHLLR
jgi:dihydroflavonol-4-reductase